MGTKSIHLKTLIGLPIVLVIAGGIAYGAANWSSDLQTSSTEVLTADENTNAIENLNGIAQNTNSADSAYIFLRTALEEAVAREWTGTPAQYRAAAEANLSAYCQLLDNPAGIEYFPTGRVRDEWIPPAEAYKNRTAKDTICSFLPSTPSATISINLDEDRDGLPAVAELWYGTSDASADTDGDGFNDAEELANGYSPTGSRTRRP